MSHWTQSQKLVLLMLVACGGGGAPESQTATHEEAPPAPTFTTKRVLTGPDGVRVSIAEFGQDEAYFQLTGVRSPAANFVFRGTIEDQGGGHLVYKTQWDGGDFFPIHRRSRASDVSWTLYAPGLSDGVELEWDEERSNGLDTDALYAQHVSQSQDGSLERVQTFDRPAAEQQANEQIARSLERTEAECGSIPEWSFNWESVSDEVLGGRRSVSGYCENILQALRNLCRWDPAKKLVREQVQRIQCSWGDEWSLRLEGGTLAWTVSPDATNLHEKAREALMALQTTDDMPLSTAISYAQTDVCMSDDESKLVVVHPHRQDGTLGISYGTTELLYHTPQPYQLSRGWFFDPRQFREGNNSNFRGRDLRYYSHVDVDRDENTCSLTCGDRETNLTLAAPDRARALLMAAETRPAPFNREPYALARDRSGTYYYVDRGNTEDTHRDFHVYKGRRGRMERLEMRDIVSDSEGEIFSTESGDLRLVVDNEGAQWIRGTRPQELRRVPIQDNYQLIMRDLGVYLGERFELPCDDF